MWSRFDTRDVAVCRSQVTREPASDTISAGMESTSLVNMVSQGWSAEYQTDHLVYNIETVTFPHHFFIESSSKCLNHNNLILISTSDSGEMSQQAPYTVLHNKIPKLITTAFWHPYLQRQPKCTTTKRSLVVPDISYFIQLVHEPTH